MSLSITIPYAPYRIPVQMRRDIVSVSLSKNNQLRTGYGNQALVRAAKRQMAEDVAMLMKAAGWGDMRLPLVMDALIRTRTAARKDDDGAWTALYAARDALAKELGIDDSEIRTGAIVFQRGATEETVITIREAP